MKESGSKIEHMPEKDQNWRTEHEMTDMQKPGELNSKYPSFTFGNLLWIVLWSPAIVGDSVRSMRNSVRLKSHDHGLSFRSIPILSSNSLGKENQISKWRGIECRKQIGEDSLLSAHNDLCVARQSLSTYLLTYLTHYRCVWSLHWK